MRTWPGPVHPSLARLFSALAALALFGACESTPCVGDTCPNACNGADCNGVELESPDAGTTGQFTSCDSDASCDVASGFECVDGSCLHACRSHFDCGGVGVCEPSRRGKAYCALTNPPTEPGGYYSVCPGGECDAERGFFCFGSGVGDTTSYCTSDCAGDRDCPAGFLCDAVQGPDGQAHDACVPRGFCSECDSDADCLAVPNGVCARDASGERRCTTLCTPDRNSCPWGSATECLVTDDELGVATCQHRSGSCRGSGAGCDPCERDADCPSGYCYESFYTAERFCIDQEAACTCAGLAKTQDFCAGAANGCAASPSGFQMICYDPGTAGGGICVGVNLPGSSASSGQLSCWR
jgi:hypothetical protein